MERTEESVLVALKELQDIETRRKREEDAERARREALEAEAREKVRREAEARRAAEAQRAADEVSAEARRKSDEAARRMEMLRAELAAVQADRQRLQERMLDPVIASATPAPAGRSRGVMALLGLVAVCSVGLAGFLALRPPPPPLVIHESPARVVAPPADVPAVEPALPVVAPPPVASAPMAPTRPRPQRPSVRHDTPAVVAPAADPCEGSLDPTCGVDTTDRAPSKRPRTRTPRQPPRDIPDDL